MNVIYATLLVVGINAALLTAIFKGVQWLVNFQEKRKNEKTKN